MNRKNVYRLSGSALIGAIAALVVTFLVLAFVDCLGPPGERSASEEQRYQLGLKILACSPAAGAMIGIFLGGRRVSRYWLWFALVFGATCLIFTSRYKDGSLKPVAASYVNHPPCSWSKACLFAIHLSSAAIIAWPIYVLSDRRKRNLPPKICRFSRDG